MLTVQPLRCLRDMSLLQNSNAVTPSGFNIDQSMYFGDAPSTSPKLSRQFTSTGSTSPKWTFASWIKKGRPDTGAKVLYYFRPLTVHAGADVEFSIQNDVLGGGLRSNSWPGVYNPSISWDWDTDYNSSNGGLALKDYSAWYHIMHVIDHSTSPYVFIYINGVLQDYSTIYGTKSGNGYGTNFSPVSGDTFFIGSNYSNQCGNAYFAHTYWIEQQALLPTAFGEFDSDTNQWNPIEYDGTFTGNSFFLDYADASDFGKDVSGLDNHFTSASIPAHQQVIDTPQNTNGGSFAVINGGDTDGNSSWGTGVVNGKLQNGNRTMKNVSGVAKGRATFPLDEVNGSYWEVRWGAATDCNCGILKFADNSMKTSSQIGADPAFPQTGYKGSTGVIATDGSTEATYATAAAGDIVAFAYKAGRLYVGKVASAGAEATWFNSGNPSNGTGYVNATAKTDPNGQNWTAGFGISHTVNFGQDSSFAGTETAQANKDANGFGQFWGSVPTGYRAMCSSNLPNSTIDKPEVHFNTVLYTGNGGSSTAAITGVGFQTDLNWIKKRNGTTDHYLTNSVTGLSKGLLSNTTAASDSIQRITSFDSDGFTLPATLYSYVNTNGDNYTAWNWLAANGTTSNTDGGITSTVSVNTTAGFSIVKWAGNSSQTTVGHGLSVAPSMVMIKDVDNTNAWVVWTPALTDGRYSVELNETSAQSNTGWSGVTTAPTAAYFNVANNSAVNATGRNYVAFCWNNVEGYSKSGMYTGNGLTEGMFIYTGFRPAWVMLKCFNTGGSWPMVDKVRNFVGSSSTIGRNGSIPRLRANTSGIEDDMNRILLQSNGFKIPVSYAESNGNGNSYLYLAFAKSPFKNSRAR